MASKRRNNAASTQRSQTPAKSEPKPNNEGQLNQEKLETLANKAFDSVTEQQFEQVTTTSPPEDFNPQDCWLKAQLFETAIKNIEADRQRLDETTKQLESQVADLEKKEAAIKLEKTSLQQAKQGFEQEQNALKQERQSFNNQVLELSTKERQLKELETNAEAGFMAQNQAALKALDEATENLRQERDRLYQEIAERRRSLDSEIAQQQDRLAQELDAKRHQYENDFAARQVELDAQQQELLILRKEIRREQKNLKLERELLLEDQESIDLKVQRLSSSSTEKFNVKIQILEERLKQSNSLRQSFEQKLLQRTEADRRFGDRTPDQVMAELTSLGEENQALRQQISELPSQASLERLQQLETLQETWESERLQLKTRVQEQERALSLSRVEVSNLETLRNEKEAMEASNSRLRKALEDLRGDLALSIADDQKRSQFEHCAAMDQNTLLQKTSQLYKEITDLRAFAKDLRDRIALSQGKGKELYYSNQDIRAFLGGLAMSRLHILQGISGTGKTSLPRAFAHAMGVDNYTKIEVQAGWRDRQDLIGYFNAFEGRFVENDFLRAIYKAQTPRCQDQVYIVLLDEMNLSRPEQYFADFLSKLEDIESGETPPLKLQSDLEKHFPRLFQDKDLLLPPNVWFIGTANQDETTLEFADKTYDRAHVMELHQQAKPFDIGKIESRHPVSYSALTNAFNIAKKNHLNKADESWDFINESKLRDLLKRFRLGWGNRLKRQIDSFVPVVIAAGGTVGEATDHIFATKVLRKLRDRHDTPIDDLKQLQTYIVKNWQLLDQSSNPVQSLNILQEEIHRLSGGELS
ncbi:hypothetical protein [Pseudanabaena sp. ABRG5-3]|uniref:hypothetical protein n=1 Tax=Pseudanabaena sp. ABRG5-3 TaxID=685565 RepID=UPI000DC6E0F5|nr:hypothetical protein [Pseudanabaena sp. ABRG5-3]BBC26702.1 hypothetical protein ABRG53_a128 [Pseudanabaena sp. ABRG5-3]